MNQSLFETELEPQTNQVAESSPSWQPLESVHRRVLGVLIEKAKTTPDSYPLTLNSITTACNQKSNRKPQMQLEAEDVTQALDDLRELGAVIEVHGDGRVTKFRHQAYEWLGVNKVELAVLAELLLRGEQTVGELRGRAARMEAIKDLSELRPILASLGQKGLLLELTPPGRGQVVTHGLYPDDQRPAPPRQTTEQAPRAPHDSIGAPAPPVAAPVAAPASSGEEIENLRRELRDLAERVAAIESRLGD